MFETYSEDNKLQVTSDSLNISLASEQLFTASTQYYQMPNGIYALQPSTGYSSKITHRFQNDLKLVINGDAGSKIYTFSYSRQPSNSDYGLQIFDGNGNLTFTSEFASLNVVDHIQMSMYDSNNQLQTFQKDYGTTSIAIIPNKIPLVFLPVGAGLLSTSVWSFTNGNLKCYVETTGISPPVSVETVISSTIDFLVIDTSYF